ncbi:hypothetical protein C2R22_21370 (plasmid) [Salinigranum rubrum]|uniref:DUF4330 domain-containing protein n=1 Tax=Salinigranum rubrum TaxID=755307 RepID=A0A2I8VQH8_9EURY|nr:DUF4330 family protein [Salinigranum rubrum]AUV84134.1 hypothetical protein C2R22_21370 [Salinigranum rubrum]
MEILDEDGNLLGVVNIVDAFVIIFILAVIIGGVTLVFGEDNADEEPTLGTTHVTLDFGTQPAFIASEINTGDTYSAGGNSQLTLTDVYFASQGNGTRIIARAALQAPVSGDSISYSDAPPRLGRTLEVTTDRYQVSGQIQSVGQNESLVREDSAVVLESVMGTAEAREVTAGDQVRLGGRTVATIENVNKFATQDPDQTRLVVGVSLQTLALNGQQQFGTTPIQQGTAIMLDTGEYTFSGPIQRVGTSQPLESVTTRTVKVQMSDIREERASAIQPGMTEQNGDLTTARVTDVEIRPSPMILTADNGSVNVAEHPVNRDVVITMELRMQETRNGVRFKGQSLRQGSTVVFDLGTISIEASVVNVSA